MRSVARLVPAIVACVATVVLAGCATTPGVGTVIRGVPDGVTGDSMSESPAAVWIERGESFAVVTMGSSSCPAVATAVNAEGEDRVSVTFGPSTHNPCTADMALTTHQFDLPEGVTDDPIMVEIRFEEPREVYTLTLD